MKKDKPAIAVGQEWERSAGQWSPTRIRIKDAGGPTYVHVVSIELGKDGKERELRPRQLLRGALNNTRSGWILVKEEGK